MGKIEYVVRVEKEEVGVDGDLLKGYVYRSLFVKDGFFFFFEGIFMCWDIFEYVFLFYNILVFYFFEVIFLLIILFIIMYNFCFYYLL